MTNKVPATTGSKIITPPQNAISNVGGVSNATRTELSVSNFPPIKFDQPTDWLGVGGLVASILAFFITAYIVWKTTRQQVTVFQESIAHQKKLAEDNDRQIRKRVKAEILSKNRQDWINALRDTTAQYIAALLKISDMHSYKAGTESANSRLPIGDAIKNNMEWCLRLEQEKSNLVNLQCKIHLLANPSDSDFKSLLNKIDTLHEMAMDQRMGLHIYAPEIIQLTQVILKNEWERVKTLEGFV